MVILGIETSCDETSASVVENGTKLLSLITATSQSMHAKYGGIIPNNAAREQLKSILPVITEALETSGQKLATISAIAVTYGPGLIGSLLVGVETAKALALAWNKPIIPVNHLIGHIYANWLDTENIPQFPSLVLLVSGGHSELILMKDHGEFELLGSTRDDAAGECFDKCGRLIGLPYPYGIYVQDEAAKHQPSVFKPIFPRPMLHDKTYDFSFSGLKTAVMNYLTATKPIADSLAKQEHLKAAAAYELQEAITDCLVGKTLKAAEEFKPKSILLAGGVAANVRLREKIQTEAKKLNVDIPVHIPPLKFCTDNGAVIASAAFFNQNFSNLNTINADPSLQIIS